MKVVLLLGPSSAGKSTLCEELQSSHQWEVVAGDVLADKRYSNAGEAIKNELNANLIAQLSHYMTEDELVRFCKSGKLNISKGNHLLKDYQVQGPLMPDIEMGLSKAGFSNDEITSLSKMLRAVGKVHLRYFSVERLQDALLDEAFSKRAQDSSIIIDTVPVGAERLLATFNKRADKYRKEYGEYSLDTSVVLALIPPQKLSERVQQRNVEADKSQNPKNKREGLFPFHQLGDAISAKSSSESTSKTLGTVSNPELLKIAYRHNPYKPHEKKSFRRPARAAVEYVRLSKKMGMPKDKAAQAELSVRTGLKYDAIINMAEGNPKEQAEQLLTIIEVKSLMAKARIPGTSIAYVDSKGKVSTKEIGTIDKDPSSPNVTTETVFGAASLSKTVFAYLMLKLDQQGILKLDDKIQTILPFEEFCQAKEFDWVATEANIKRLQQLNGRMILSHTSGLELHKDNPVDFMFEPGTEYLYSGIPMYYLQSVVERKTGKTLEQLAQEYIFGPLKMTHSTFLYNLTSMPEPDNGIREPKTIYLKQSDKGLAYEVMGLDDKIQAGIIPWNKLPEAFPHHVAEIVSSKSLLLPELLNHTHAAGHTQKPDCACSANSLFTTSSDLGLFVADWINNKELQFAFEPVKRICEGDKSHDKWANPSVVSKHDQQFLATGLGWDLELDEKGEVIRAYKTGDMNKWRGQVVIDFSDKENKVAILFFANSPDGHMLADKIIVPNIDMKHGLNYFFQKYGFVRGADFEKEISKYCDVLLMNSPPTLKTLERLSSNPTYVRSGDHLYYLNKEHHICHQIKFDDKQYNESVIIRTFDIFFSPEKTVKTLSQDDMKYVASITGKPHWHHLEEGKFATVDKYVDSRYETVSDEKMAESVFGLGSNTAKSLQEHKSTTARLIASGIAKSASSGSSIAESSEKPSERKIEPQEIMEVKQADKTDKDKQEQTHEPPSLFRRY